MLQQLEGQTKVAKNGGAQRMSAERRRRYRNNAKTKGRERHPGANVIWRRIKDNIDELVVRVGADPALASVVTRMVLFGHLTPEQGEIARYYAGIMRRYAKFNGELPHTLRAQDINRASGGFDVIEAHETAGTLASYEKRAKSVRKQHDRVERVLLPYMHARDVLDDICLNEKEVNASLYPSIRAMLMLIGEEFGLTTGRAIGSNNAKGRPKAKDIKLVVDAAIEALEAFAKRHKAVPFAYTIGDGKERGRHGPTSFFLRLTAKFEGTEQTLSPVLEVKTLGLLPSAVLSQLLRACEAKGWKEIEK